MQTAEGAEYHVAAIRATNNTAEMQGSRRFWLNSCVEQKGPSIFQQSDDNSRFVRRQGAHRFEKFVARENRALAILLFHMWRVTKKEFQLHIRWVRGHTGDVGISIADELADLRTRPEAQHRWWKRAQPMGGWEEDVFIAKISSLRREKHRVNKLFVSGGTGAVNFPRSDPILQERTPLLGVITNAIAPSAVKRGSAKNKKSCLDPQDDGMIAMRRLCQER